MGGLLLRGGLEVAAHRFGLFSGGPEPQARPVPIYFFNAFL